MPRKRFTTLLIGGIWIINLLILFGLASAYVLRARAEGSAGPPTPAEVADTNLEEPALTIAPTASRSPTRTATLAPTTTPTYAQSTPGKDQASATSGPGPTASATLVRLAQIAREPEDLLPTPTPTNRSVIGYSVGGRELQVYRFGSGPTGRLIIAGIHGGNEGNTVLMAHELIEYVSAHPEMIPKHISLYILPNLNPDGFARVRGHDGRVNDHGVDLNRNWPWNWQVDWPRSGCWDYRPVTGGVLPLSEPETLALYRFIVEHPDIDALISYHAAALGIFAGGVPDYKPSISLATTVDTASTYDYPPIDTHCTMTGDLTDWAATWYIAAVDIELHNFRYTDFEDNLAILKAFLKWHR
jgi:hypothetical protein